MKIVVVGAGLAGLTCAWTLQRRGAEVMVLEARDRVGGRTWSHRLGVGSTVERGGEFIDAEQHEIRRLCATLGLPLVPHGVPFGRRTAVGGSRPSVAEVAEVMSRLRGALDERLARGEGDCSLLDVMVAALGPGAAALPTCQRIMTSVASDPAQTSASLALGRTSAAVDAGSRVLGGNQAIALALAAELAADVHLRSEVVAVEDGRETAGVTLRGGGLVQADAVVVAVPLPLLDAIEWRPGRPEKWEAGLRQLGFGEAAKLSAALAEPAAPRGVQGPAATWWSWNSFDEQSETSMPSVTAFAGGPLAMASLDVAHGAGTWTKELWASRPDLLPGDPADAVVTVWASEEFTRGAYSFGRTGWDEAAAVELQEVAGRLVLAGEHTAGRQASSMNGAVVSGLRAAEVLLPPRS